MDKEQGWRKGVKGCLDEDRPLQRKGRQSRSKAATAARGYSKCEALLKSLTESQCLHLFLNRIGQKSEAVFKMARASLSEEQIGQLASQRLSAECMAKLKSEAG